MKRLYTILTILILTGCSKDPYEEYNITNKQRINQIAKPYFDQFKKEAKIRGFDVSNYDIDFYLADMDDFAGLAIPSNNEIILERDYWNLIDSNRKAFLIFHELGHFILNRKHTNKQTDNQECLSFMRDRTKSDECQLNYYSELWKELYFDELFYEDNSIPLWYTNNKVYNSNYENKDLLFQKLNNEDKSYQLEIDMDTISNFVFEVTFKNWQSTLENSPFRNTKVNLNGINFESNPNRNTVDISNNNYSRRYFSKWDYAYRENIKLTIKRNEGVYSFFIDENLVHITDIDNLENETIKVDFSAGIEKDIIIYEFE